MNINKLPQVKIRDILLFLSIVLFAISVSNKLPVIISEGTIGSFLRNIIPTIPFLLLIAIIYMIDFSSLRISSIFSMTYFKSNIKYPFFVWILILLTPILFGLVISKYNSMLGGMMYSLLFLSIFSSFFAAIYISFKYRIIYGIIIFLISSPILIFLQRNFHFKVMPSTLLSITLTPMLIFALTLFYINVTTNLFQNKKIPNSPLNKAIFIFIASMILTTLISSEELIQSYKGIFQEIIIPLIFFFLTITSVDNKKDIERVLISVSISIIGICFLSLYFYAWFNPLDISTARGEIAGKIGDYQRSYILPLIIGLPIFLALIEIFNTKLKRIMAITGTIFLLIFTIVLQSLSALFSIIIGSSLVIIRSQYKKKYVYICGLLFILIILIPVSKDVLFLRFKNVDLSKYRNVTHHFLEARLIGWKGAIDHIKDYPFFGAGYGMYYERKHLYTLPIIYFYRDEQGVRRQMKDYMQAHSLYLENAADCGLIGLSALLFLIFSIFKVSIKAVKESSNRNEKIISASILGSITSFFIMSITSPTNFGAGMNFIWGALLWTLIGLICVIRKHQMEARE